MKNRKLHLGLLLWLLAPAVNAATFLGPTPYLCFYSSAIAGCDINDSPFKNLAAVVLEDFEDGFNTNGVTDMGGSVTGPGGITDSVDEDDGVIDDSGQLGRSFFGFGGAGITFEFNAALLGALPTHVGIVWTDGATFNNVTFEAFGAVGESLGTVFAPNAGDGDFESRTAEDRFFGVISGGSVSKIHIISPRIPGSSGSGIEVDHLQFTLVPVPAAVWLFGSALISLLGVAEHKKNNLDFSSP